MLMAVAVCKVGGRFSRCRNDALNTCQYCARPFCADHAYHLYDHEAVCTGKICRAKQDDLSLHLVYRQRIGERNRAGLCGQEGCGPHPTLECSLCQGHFCDLHIFDRHYPIRQGTVVIERPVSVCGWCWRRRKLWRR